MIHSEEALYTMKRAWWVIKCMTIVNFFTALQYYEH